MVKGTGMNARIRKLRRQSIEAKPALSIERAQIVTEVYDQYEGKVSIPVLRALTFKELMARKSIFIGDGELIVGERGPKPQMAPTYPELCCHSLEDFRVIAGRDKISFAVSEEALMVQEKTIISRWEGRSMRDLIFDQMEDEWLEAYHAGIFTEFMEQRAPGHTVADDKIYRKGFLVFQSEIEEEIEALDFLNDPQALAKHEQLKAMAITCQALILFAQRHSQLAEQMADQEEDPVRREELLMISKVCKRVPAHAPESYWEALQMYWFVHLGVITELNTWDSFSPGRFDQHLYPFYVKDLKSGALDREGAKELLECFWIKVNNQPAPPKVGITMQESATYTDFCNINIGGLDADGADGVNDVSYLFLEVINEMRTLQPSSNVQISRKTQDQFVVSAAKVIQEGMGFPSVFNADAVVEELLRQGKSLDDARGGGTSGCVEVGCFGKEAYILTGYFNLVKILELTLHQGRDPRTGRQLGPDTGDPRTFDSFDQLMEAYRIQLNYFVDVKIRGNNRIESLYAEYMPAPFMSVVIDDCISSAKDYNAGGARYNSRYIQAVGIGSITDALASIDCNVFEQKRYSMDRLLTMLQSDFEGDEAERQWMLNRTPKYGNDDDIADRVMQQVFEIALQAIDNRPTPLGGRYRLEMLPTTCHVYFGSVIGATPDGRKAGTTLSEGISPVQGADRKGPTAVIRSAAKMDQLKTGGTLLNQKFSPDIASGPEGARRLKDLIRTYFRMDGHHIQFNVVSAQTLRSAQENPEAHRSLIVRVAGYSDYFGNLGKDLQDEIISRTEHAAF